MQSGKNIFENLYDTYSTMLYSIALEISPTKRHAEQILSDTFKEAHKQNLASQKNPAQCIALIKLIIQTARHQLNNNKGKINFRLKQFENTPLLHKLLCEQINLEDHCTQNKVTRSEAAKQMREEFISLFPLRYRKRPACGMIL